MSFTKLFLKLKKQKQFPVEKTQRDSWVLAFNYHNSTHQITLNLGTNATIAEPWENELILVAIIALFSIVLAIETKYWLCQKQKRT